MRNLDTLVYRSPLGYRFIDPALDLPVTDGLVVTARPLVGGPTIKAQQNGEGIYLFGRLPGVPADGVWPADSPAAPPLEFLIEVQDRLSRFLPVATVVSLPAAESLKEFFLFSAPTRRESTGLGVIRGQLWDQSADQPAAYGVLEAEDQDGETWYGVADDRGCVALLFPYPVFGTSQTGSPPGSTTVLMGQGWSYTLTAWYQPQSVTYPTGSSRPELKTVLAQAACSIVTATDPSVTTAPSLTLSVQFGQPFVLRTDGGPALRLSPP